MGYLHARGIVHKDLNSKNIFVEKYRIVITDFGLLNVADTRSPLERQVFDFIISVCRGRCSPVTWSLNVEGHGSKSLIRSYRNLFNLKFQAYFHFGVSFLFWHSQR